MNAKTILISTIGWIGGTILENIDVILSRTAFVLTIVYTAIMIVKSLLPKKAP